MPYDKNILHDENLRDWHQANRGDVGRDDEDHDDEDHDDEDAARSIELLEAVERESHRLLRQAERLVCALSARANLDPAAFRCLHLLARHETLSMRRLSTLAGLGSDATLAAVDTLESAGLVRRCRGGVGCGDWCSGDGRVTDRHDVNRCDLVRVDQEACRARIGPALRELREAWYPLTVGRRDDLALITAVLANGRRLSELVLTLG
ncbi:helix-turn-helix domain-containing protein [Thermopolyspora sp. NPDC052614]|uniref:helix-turn-helix domain-containing protein n=1 Tax=Thermopolyspora sp. NPDC052614 TaxID=3155682 RepID=UPI0034270A00